MSKLKKNLKENIGFLVVLCLCLLFLFNNNARTFVTNQLFKLGFFTPSTTETTVPKDIKSDIIFRDGNGEIVSLADTKGKVVFINFWATWCPPCIAEMPSIQKLFDKTQRENILFIMAEVDGDYQKAKAFMNKKSYTLPVYSLASSAPEEIFDGTIPTTLVLDKTGKLVLRHKGLANYGDDDFANYLIKIAED